MALYLLYLQSKLLKINNLYYLGINNIIRILYKLLNWWKVDSALIALWSVNKIKYNINSCNILNNLIYYNYKFNNLYSIIKKKIYCIKD